MYLNELLNGTEKSAVAAIPPLVSAYPPGLEPPPHGSIGKTLAGAGIGAGAGTGSIGLLSCEQLKNIQLKIASVNNLIDFIKPPKNVLQQ